MKKALYLFLFYTSLVLSVQSQDVIATNNFPDSIYSGKQGRMHVQGMAVDKENGYIYFSFTDKLVKMDFSGQLIGSVTGFVGHLGDLDFNKDDGRIYGSLEYKNDVIGKGIKKTLGRQDNKGQNGFYIAIFDGSRIVRADMNVEAEDLLRTVHLKEVLKDYETEVSVGDKTMPHRFACSGIDGITFAPSFGSNKSHKMHLYVAYGIYDDVKRDDNDHQVLLKYDVSNWNKYAKHLSQDKLHRSGPNKPQEKYFVKTGNTKYGIQNLAYDSYTGNMFAAVYRGSKTLFPNFDLFVIDGNKKPYKSRITSDNKSIKVKTLSLLQTGPNDVKSGIRGWYFKWGATGLQPLGDGLFYISHNGKAGDGQQHTTIYKYKWVGNSQNAFIRNK